MKKSEWHDDQEYLQYVGDLLATPEVQRLANFKQHYFSNRLEHSISVSYASYCIAKKMHLNAKATARAGLLHDLFYYDWRTTKFSNGTHAWIHPRIAVRNAEKITHLTKMERDIIIKHMWGATIAPPRYLEGYIVTMVDKYEATSEVSVPLMSRYEHLLKEHLGFAK
ncbi:HD domain-containing protein [Liquorilactobacillus satsumensis]|uniref:HD superfamily hydrolase n=1 Tax=Liquorilactobacillus satsumensis DSM 16230 = JCM 12392 TaxID=1423801 RepID=A0A0R1UXZ7_9LACO|nr:HD domain-containing protein [Liquorilactobacillus satsumensis]KRL98022.1 HD superfamily hydrolase [Liquorilactobacillus satsumensis DSM 16230 = JCM 12392]MCC7667486.1 HAD family hydrolase [Liquorilactobacillus satsumensis]MCP9312313.1 HAD family hydrolase [Liquorilactobacillus satsumensis]MCP9327712.1 HAD family hydrolase [Liquorilactobacillus satsumensis]MCP9357017.1 HAD family hydrolase [Liquorilactobacillus satsumensis]